jgi:hypothetical protein
VPTSDERERAERVVAELTEQLREIVNELAVDMALQRRLGTALAVHEERALAFIKASREDQARREILLMNDSFPELNDLQADVEVLRDLARQCREGIAMAEAVLRAPN